MRVLILEDYSGLGRLLKDALSKSGCEVVLIATSQTIELGRQPDHLIQTIFSGIFGKFERRLRLLIVLLSLPKFSSCLILNQSIIFSGISSLILFLLKIKTEKIYLSVCGLDSIIVRPEVYKRVPGIADEELVDRDFLHLHRARGRQKIMERIMSTVKGVIPVSKAFYLGWAETEYKEKLYDPIPIPLPLEDVSREASSASTQAAGSRQLKFIHFVSRAEKGSKTILDGFQKARKKYHKKATFVALERQPFKVFLDKLSNCDVFIDRCTGSYYGTINTLLALALGKIVITSNLRLEVDAENWKENPIVIASNSSASVLQAIDVAAELANQNRDEYARRCISFLSTNHSPENIGKKYLSIFSD